VPHATFKYCCTTSEGKNLSCAVFAANQLARAEQSSRPWTRREENTPWPSGREKGHRTQAKTNTQNSFTKTYSTIKTQTSLVRV